MEVNCSPAEVHGGISIHDSLVILRYIEIWPEKTKSLRISQPESYPVGTDEQALECGLIQRLVAQLISARVLVSGDPMNCDGSACGAQKGSEAGGIRGTALEVLVFDSPVAIDLFNDQL
jgi:hypothetical protein